jgi:hypothetical protein
VAIREPFPELDEILASIGEGGQRIGERAEGLTIDEMRAVVEAFDVKTTIV